MKKFITLFIVILLGLTFPIHASEEKIRWHPVWKNGGGNERSTYIN